MKFYLFTFLAFSMLFAYTFSSISHTRSSVIMYMNR